MASFKDKAFGEKHTEESLLADLGISSIEELPPSLRNNFNDIIGTRSKDRLSTLKKTAAVSIPQFKASQDAIAAETLENERQQAVEAEQKQAFSAQQGATREAFSPFAQGGKAAFQEQQALLGLLGIDRQMDAQSRVTESPEIARDRERAEKLTAANAAATGRRGSGSLIEDVATIGGQARGASLNNRFNQLGGLSGIGLGATGAGLGENVFLQGQNANQFSQLGFQQGHQNQQNLGLGQGLLDSQAAGLSQQLAAQLRQQKAASKGPFGSSFLNDALGVAQVAAPFLGGPAAMGTAAFNLFKPESQAFGDDEFNQFQEEGLF